MIYLTTMFVGALSGGVYARRQKGNGFDIAQYAAVWAVIGFILGMIATVIVDRLT